MKKMQSFTRCPDDPVIILSRGKNHFPFLKYFFSTAILVFLLVFAPGCDLFTDDPAENVDVVSYNDAVVDLNKSLEDFILKTQIYESTSFTGKTHAESKKIIDDFIASGEKLKSDMDMILSSQKGRGGSLKSLARPNDLPTCGPVDLIPGTDSGLSPGLAKAVGDLIAETKGEVSKIEEKHNKGEIDDNVYNEALNKLKIQNTTKAVNIGFGAVMGGGASVVTGLALGSAGVAILPAVAIVTGVGVLVGTTVTWLCNKESGLKSKNGYSGNQYMLTTGKSKIGEPIPTSMMVNGADLTICIDGYAPVYLKNIKLPAKGHEQTIEIKPVKMEDATNGGTTEVCFSDKVMTASSCAEVMFVNAAPYPFDPGPNQSVTVTATIIPAVAGCDISFSMSGTDGYTKSGTYPTNASGEASFYIPGGAGSVVDHVTITSSNGKTYTVTYVF
jgi:hypothetical protein